MNGEEPDTSGARMWLDRRGVAVDSVTPLLALRLGARMRATRSGMAYTLLSRVLWVVAVVPPIPAPVRFLVFGVGSAVVPLVRWRGVRQADHAAERLVPPGARPSPRAAARQVGWWYLAAVATTFGGGAVLCLGGFALNPVLWGTALAIGAASVAPVLVRALRAPVIAEDGASLFVDTDLRAYDVAIYALPFPFAFLVWIDLSTTWPWPPSLFLPPLGYLVLVVAAHAGAVISIRRRRSATATPG